MARILIIEDESSAHGNLSTVLASHGYQIEQANTVQDAIDNFALAAFNLIITELQLTGQAGTDIIPLAQGVPVLVMTDQASLRSAVEAMKLGAADYLAKPFDHDELIQRVSKILAHKAPIPAQRDNHFQPENEIYGKCTAMQAVFKIMKKVAPTEATVLIQGETGTGKELAARAIHKLSRRHKRAYICVNCAAIPESLIESELFGHEKGAFTGAVSARNGLIEAADGGTLFLDEIGELPLEAQARLLRVLQEGEIRRVGSTQSRKVNVRLVAATHRNLKALAKSGQFREDLYYRLNVVQVRLPPLRERGSDIDGLTYKLMAKIANKLGYTNLHASEDALQAMRRYNWPGNVRELENAIERGAILCDNYEITADLLDIDTEVDDISIPESLVTPTRPSAVIPTNSSPKTLSIEDYFQQFVLENESRMSETELAQRLGISRKSLWERRQKLGIPRKKKA